MHGPSVPVIEARGLTKTYGPPTAVDGVGFAIQAGECFVRMQSAPSASCTTRMPF